MKCEEVQTWMLTDESPQRPTPEVRRHVRSCASCRKQFGRLVRLIHEVETAPLPSIPSAARDQLLARLEPRTGADLPLTPPAPPQRGLPRLPFSGWRQWAPWAAAALVFLMLGLGLAGLLRRGHSGPEDQHALDHTPDPVVPKTTVEDRLLEQHLVLAQAREPERRLDALNDVEREVRQETLTQARGQKLDDLSMLVWLHARVVHDGILRVARGLTERDRTVRSLQEAERAAQELAGRSPDAVAGPLQQLARYTHTVAVALQGGPLPAPPPAQPPLSLASRALLQVLVLTSVELAHEEDPVRRAEASSQVADTLSRQLSDRRPALEPDEATRLALSLGAVLERAVQSNLARLDLEEIDPLRRKHLERIQEKAGAAVQRMEPQLPQFPAAAQQQLRHALDVARQIRTPPPHRGPPWKKDKPKGPPWKR